MLLRSTLLVTISFIIVISSSKSMQAEPTKWEDARTSMSVLLNSGWQIIGHSLAYAKSPNTPLNSGFDEKLFTFILTKGNQYVLCISDNPRPPVANASSCRKLN
jgi:hypothetical protein